MPTHETLTIALPVEVVGSVRRAVDAGEYASADDAISAALIEWEDRRGLLGYTPEELGTLAAEGLSSGQSPYASMDDVKAEARRRWAARAD